MKTAILFLALIAAVLGADCPKPACPIVPVQKAEGQVAGFAAFQYFGENGPANWSKLNCATGAYAIFAGCSYCTNECGGSSQSPVDVRPTQAMTLPWITDVKFELGASAKFEYAMASGAYKLNCATLGTCGSVRVGNETYDVLQLHTHQQSEHKLNGSLYPTEVHVVHIRNGSQLLVVGVLFKEGVANPELQKFIDIATSMGAGELSIAAMIGEAVKPEYMTLYSGSLTTPPCSEGVRWSVSSKVITASRAQINALVMLAGGKKDNRPVQPLNGRRFYKF